MASRSRLAAVLSLALLVSAAQARADQGLCTAKLPANIDAGVFGTMVLDILARSETFRLQCLRIAAVPVLRVHLGIAAPPAVAYRALTVLARYDAGSLRADVTLVFAENYVELLGHEFEHVLEQIEGVNLRAAAARGRAQLLPDGAYETRRATEAGRQVLREYEAPAPHVERPVIVGWRCRPPGGAAPAQAPAAIDPRALSIGRIASHAAAQGF